jgi:catechol 2,3-dioxygenase-like lactoylglutathione lyase family enzyme
MFKRIDHIELVTADPQRAQGFYTEVLGFRMRESLTVPGGLRGASGLPHDGARGRKHG